MKGNEPCLCLKHCPQDFATVTIAGVLTTALLALGTTSASARDNNRDGYRDGPRGKVTIQKTVNITHDRHGPIVKLSRRATRVVVRGTRYHYDRGVFYTKHRGRLVAVNAPIGAFVRALPRNARVTYINGRPLYVAKGTFFRWAPRKGGYVVTKAPRGARVAHLPRGYRTVWAGGNRFYTHAGVTYLPVSPWKDDSLRRRQLLKRISETNEPGLTLSGPVSCPPIQNTLEISPRHGHKAA